MSQRGVLKAACEAQRGVLKGFFFHIVARLKSPARTGREAVPVGGRSLRCCACAAGVLPKSRRFPTWGISAATSSNRESGLLWCLAALRPTSPCFHIRPS